METVVSTGHTEGTLRSHDHYCVYHLSPTVHLPIIYILHHAYHTYLLFTYYLSSICLLSISITYYLSILCT